MKNKSLETERIAFNETDYNNQRGVIGFVMEKSRSSQACQVCEQVYNRKFCGLCEELTAHHNPSEIYKIINQRGLGSSFKLKL